MSTVAKDIKPPGHQKINFEQQHYYKQFILNMYDLVQDEHNPKEGDG